MGWFGAPTTYEKRDIRDEKMQIAAAKDASKRLIAAAKTCKQLANLDIAEIRAELKGNKSAVFKEDYAEGRSEYMTLFNIRWALVDILKIVAYQLDESRYDREEKAALARFRAPIEKVLRAINNITSKIGRYEVGV